MILRIFSFLAAKAALYLGSSLTNWLTDWHTGCKGRAGQSAITQLWDLIETWGFREELKVIVLHHSDDDNNNKEDKDGEEDKDKDKEEDMQGP